MFHKIPEHRFIDITNLEVIACYGSFIIPFFIPFVETATMLLNVLF